MDDPRLVYSTDGDLPIPQARRAKAAGKPGRAAGQLPDDGIIRIAKERRRASVVTLVHGIAPAELPETGKLLRRSCGTGGTVKGETLELQGDHRERVAAFFEGRGRKVKRIGG